MNEINETEFLHEQVWTRFVRMPYGHILDCADENGHTVLPTAAEMRACVPNVLGWMTPVENGAFFGGLYLYGLCTAYDIRPDGKLLGEIKTITNGLFLLCDVGEKDGFIARGVGEDGISHYPFSSEDQVGPWLLGLWKLRNSRAADEALRTEIDKRLLRTLWGLQRAGYHVPTEWEGETRGSYAHDDWRGASKALFCAYVLSELDEKRRDEYRTMSKEHPDDSLYTRVEIASHGFGADMVRETGLIQFWIDICAHLCLEELAAVDEENRPAYLHGMKANGVVCEKFLDDYKKYDNQKKPVYEMDWRKLLPERKPWHSAREAMDEAGRHCGLFNQICPARSIEHALLGNMVFAAWIVITCGDPALEKRGYEKLLEAVHHVDWRTMRLSYAFAAEAAIYSYLAKECRR